MPPTKVTKKRTNWDKGGNIMRLIKVAHDWYNNIGNAMYSNDDNLWLVNFCIIVGIPLSTFENYVGPNRRDIGKSVGCPLLLNPKDVTVITDALRRADRENDRYIQR